MNQEDQPVGDTHAVTVHDIAIVVQYNYYYNIVV